MNDKLSMAKHARTNVDSTEEREVDHLNLRSRFTSALLAGTLALTLCPAAAFAAQPDQGMPDQNGSVPAMQQGGGFDFQQQVNDIGAPQQDGFEPGMLQQGNGYGEPWQAGGFDAPQQDENAPNMAQAPNQAPSRTDALDDQIRQILADTYDVELTDFGQFEAGNAGEQGAPGQNGFAPRDLGEAPELPEGAINIQAIIDSVRDIMRGYSIDDLEAADFEDEAFASQLQEYVRTATDQRLEMFANNPRPSEMPQAGNAPASSFDAPSDLPAPAKNAEASGTPESAPEGAPEGTPEGAPVNGPFTEVGSTLLNQLVGFVVNTFGNLA